jgi:hypothetical protein
MIRSMTAQPPAPPLRSPFLAWPGGLFLFGPLSLGGLDAVCCSEEATVEEEVVVPPALSVPPAPPAVSTGDEAVEVLLDVPFPLALPPSPLLVVLSDAGADDPAVPELGEAPPVEPLDDPSPLGEGLPVAAPPAGGGLEFGASEPPPIDRGVLAGDDAAGLVALRFACRRTA